MTEEVKHARHYVVEKVTVVLHVAVAAAIGAAAIMTKDTGYQGMAFMAFAALLNIAAAVASAKRAYGTATIVAGMQLISSPLALLTGPYYAAVSLLLLASTSLSAYLAITEGSSEETEKYVRLGAAAYLVGVGLALIAAALICRPSPDLFRVAAFMAERRLITWRVLGVLAGLAHVLAARYVLKGRLIHYLLCIGMFVSPIFLLAQTLQAPPAVVWAQVVVVLEAYALGFNAARRAV